MARLTVGLEPGDEFGYRIYRSPLGASVHIDLAGLTLVAYDADQLEVVLERVAEAARDLRIALVDDRESKSLSQAFNGTDDTSQAMAFVKERAAKRAETEARRDGTAA